MGKIIGTAGHVDHGKTELIKTLTGIDTDRWAEEKRRGLTIDLGFAYIDLPKSKRVGIIDVPGHERFIKNMIAGVGGFDIGLLVIDANEGVMAQTIEHFHILRLLGIKKIIIGISKIDLVNEETIEIVKGDIKNLIKDSCYKDAPLVEFSSKTGQGITDIKSILDDTLYSIPDRPTDGVFTRLFIDRVFQLKGIGVVITGTLVSGKIRKGDDLIIIPSGIKTKVRYLQEHNEEKEVVSAGERVAINLQKVEKDKIKRGDVIWKVQRPTFVGAPKCKVQNLSTKKFDAYIEPIKKCGLIKDLLPVKVYFGSGEFMARLALIGTRKIEDETPFFSQIRLEEPMSCIRGDRFILRKAGIGLLGGGEVIDSLPDRYHRFRKGNRDRLEKLLKATDKEALSIFLEDGFKPLSTVKKKIQLHPEKFNALLNSLKDKVDICGNYIFKKEKLDSIKNEIVSKVKEFHKDNPLKIGIDKERLKIGLKFDDETFDEILNIIDEIEARGRHIKARGFSLKLEGGDQIVRDLESHRFQPPLIKVDDLVRALIEKGVLMKVSEDIIFPKSIIEEAKRIIKGLFKDKEKLRASEIKEALGTTRKYAVPLLEYFDRQGFTKRVGDVRILKK